MDDYLTGLIFISFAVTAFTFFQLKDGKYQRLKKDLNRLEAMCSSLQEERRKAEIIKENLEKGIADSMKSKEQLRKTKIELREAKMSSDYLSAKKLEHMEKYIAACIQSDSPDLIFLETFQPLAMYTFRERLNSMLEDAEFEINIISPWIKRSAWEGIRIPIIKFAKNGGALKVFLKGDECDFSNGLCDDIRKDVEDMGGEVILIKQLHAKIYIMDKKEAILASANLTRGGVESNLEAGIWSNNPPLIREICKFVDNLYLEGKR
jgi:hypothetical protein